MIASARMMSGWARRTIRARSRKPMLTLLKMMIIPRLEYCCPLWSPYDKAQINQLESDQREFTRQFKEFQTFDPAMQSFVCTTPYWSRLKTLHLFSLQRRRERYIILYLVKVINGLVPNPGNRIQIHYNARTKYRLSAQKPPRNAPAWVKTLR